MGTIIVAVIVFGIIGFSAYRTFKKYKNGNGCDCGCDGCSKSDSCHTH